MSHEMSCAPRKLRPGRPATAENVAAFAERFNRYVDRSTGSAGCWLWTGSWNKTTGYGMSHWPFAETLTCRQAHRVAYLLANGMPRLLRSQMVCHRCDVRRCCNPSHLFLGTAKENIADAMAKGRDNKRFGDTHPCAKLTADAVREIRRMAASGVSGRSLAKKFGLSSAPMGRLLRGETWRHVEP